MNQKRGRRSTRTQSLSTSRQAKPQSSGNDANIAPEPTDIPADVTQTSSPAPTVNKETARFVMSAKPVATTTENTIIAASSTPTIQRSPYDPVHGLQPKIVVLGVGGAGGNAVNNMIEGELDGVSFFAANTDAQALALSKAEVRLQMGMSVTEGLGAGSQPEIGRASAEEVADEMAELLQGAHLVFITAGMGGGTGTGASPIFARIARDMGILTVGVVTKPFQFEGQRRMRIADHGIQDLQEVVDTLIVIPNQNLFRVANERTTFSEAFALADDVLYSGVSCVTDLMVREGLINLDFADVRSVMRNMGKAMMGTGESGGEGRAIEAANQAVNNPLLDEVSMRGAQGLLVSITGGSDLTLFEVDEAANRIRDEVDPDANIIVGAAFDAQMEGSIRVAVVASGIEDRTESAAPSQAGSREAEKSTAASLSTSSSAVTGKPVNDAVAGDHSRGNRRQTASRQSPSVNRHITREGVTIRSILPASPTIESKDEGPPSELNIPQPSEFIGELSGSSEQAEVSSTQLESMQVPASESMANIRSSERSSLLQRISQMGKDQGTEEKPPVRKREADGDHGDDDNPMAPTHANDETQPQNEEEARREPPIPSFLRRRG